jgi:hypothetical protein
VQISDFLSAHISGEEKSISIADFQRYVRKRNLSFTVIFPQFFDTGNANCQDI